MLKIGRTKRYKILTMFVKIECPFITTTFLLLHPSFERSLSPTMWSFIRVLVITILIYIIIVTMPAF